MDTSKKIYVVVAFQTQREDSIFDKKVEIIPLSPVRDETDRIWRESGGFAFDVVRFGPNEGQMELVQFSQNFAGTAFYLKIGEEIRFSTFEDWRYRREPRKYFHVSVHASEEEAAKKKERIETTTRI